MIQPRFLTRAPICRSGPRERYALIVAPMQERAAQAWLARQEVYSHYPVETRRSVIRGRLVRRESRLLPGYLFAEFRGSPYWYRVLNGPLVRNVIRTSSGEPGQIMGSSWDVLENLASAADQIVQARRDRRRIRRGDRVRIKSGPFAESEVEVIELAGPHVRFSLKLLGASVVQTDIENVEKITDEKT